jgi:hypothetical protein
MSTRLTLSRNPAINQISRFTTQRSLVIDRVNRNYPQWSKPVSFTPATKQLGENTSVVVDFTNNDPFGRTMRSQYFRVGVKNKAGSLPPVLQPVSSKGGWSDLAHEAEKARKLANLFGDTTKERVRYAVIGDDGEPLKNYPHKMPDGKTYTSDSKGFITITDSGVLDVRRMVAEHRRKRVDGICHTLEQDPSDPVACYIFGLTPEEWKAETSPYAGAEDLKLEGSDEIWMANIIAKANCSLDYLNALGNADTKEEKIAKAKLRKLVEKYESRVHLENMSGLGDFTSNMKDGHNVEPVIPADHFLANTVVPGANQPPGG